MCSNSVFVRPVLTCVDCSVSPMDMFPDSVLVDHIHVPLCSSCRTKEQAFEQV